jgi:hypothetical protein
VGGYDGRKTPTIGRGFVLLVVLLTALIGCTGSRPDDTQARTAVQEVLDRQSAAVVDGDRDRYLAAVDPQAGRYRARQRQVITTLDKLPVGRWSQQVTALQVNGGTAEAQVTLSYRLRGYDRAPVTASEDLRFRRRNGHWYVSAELPGSSTELWEQGPVTVVRGAHSLVLGTGSADARLHEVAHEADAAVPAVSRAWPRSWSQRVVVLVPDSLHDMGELLDSPGSTYQGIAAVTTGEAGSSQQATAERIVVNPRSYAVLSELGRQVVTTHETTHVATRRWTTAATPLWLSEGFADWVAYRTAGRTAQQVAPELAQAVQAGDVPETLPQDTDFRFDNGADALSRAYEGGWLACRMIADRWGEKALTSLYAEVGASPATGEDAVDDALHTVLHTNTGEFTDRWRAYLRQQLG